VVRRRDEEQAVIVAIEGIDGSGKQTQTALVCEALCARGVAASTMSFPQYGKTHFAGLIGDYLNGRLGDPADISPKLIGLLYAGDRLESRDEIEELVASRDVLVLDRYTASNLAYQGAKCTGPARDELFDWVDQVEHGVYRLPRPNLNVFLEVPVDMAMGLVRQKRGRTYTNRELDVHEANRRYLDQCREAYNELIERGIPGPWARVSCVGDDGVILGREVVRDRILETMRTHRLV